MNTPYLSPYADPEAHARISALIRRHSSNDRDVRAELLRGLDLTGARAVLDLGCGFGFWAEELAGRVAPDAVLTGVDACPGDEAAYVRCVASKGREARFLAARLVADLPFEDASFDLVVAGYSLYFFVEVLPEVARVLRPDGVFLAVTHSEESFTALLGAVALDHEACPLLRSLRRFSSEGGGPLLAAWFRRVERRNYLNTLTFEERDLPDLLAYLSFKLPLVRAGARYGAELPASFVAAASAAVRRQGRLVVDKDDTLFVCREPARDGRRDPAATTRTEPRRSEDTAQVRRRAARRRRHCAPGGPGVNVRRPEPPAHEHPWNVPPEIRPRV